MKKLKHPYGFEFETIPFLWNYQLMSNPFETYMIKEVDRKFMNKIKNVNFQKEIEFLSDNNTEFYVHSQYRSNTHDEIDDSIYLAYHSWLWDKACQTEILDNSKRFWTFSTGIFPIVGNIQHSVGYPDKGTHKMNKPGGIDINKLSTRAANIHPINGIPRFSSVNVCNFCSESKNLVFASIGKRFMEKRKYAVNKNIVVLHILRNTSNFDQEFINLVDEYSKDT